MNKSRYRFEKRANQKFAGFPVATVIFYGPTADFASKVAVSVFLSEKQDPDVLERIFSEEGSDARFDEDVLERVLSIIETHEAKTVAVPNGIYGCPHEEGIDYPEGTPCPKCPYWAGRDRDTLQRIQ